MAHAPFPCYFERRNVWYAQVGGRQHTLGKHTDNLPRPRRDTKTGKWVPPPTILTAFYKLMTEHAEAEEKAAPVEEEPSGFALVVIDRFLDWCHKHRPDSYSWYLQRLRSFMDSVPRDLSVEALKPFHVVESCDSHDDWSDSHKR